MAAVLRHRRRFLYAKGTVMCDVPELTRKVWPVTAFSGVTFSEGVVKRGSRHVPVHSTGS